MTNERINALRMERQYFTTPLSDTEKTAYEALYQDLQPGQNVYWNGFGEPPTHSWRTAFDDKEFNRHRQTSRQLIKGRFASGNIGWIMKEDLELFAALYTKPLKKPTEIQLEILHLIERVGPMDIPLMKEMTGLTAKKITPALCRLQQAFLIYEDQHDFNWSDEESMSDMSRDWYTFSEMFPDVNLSKYTKHEALKVILDRFAYRHVWFNLEMVKSFYKLATSDIKKALEDMVKDGTFVEHEEGYMLQSDVQILESYVSKTPQFIHALHRNDALVKSNEHWLKKKFLHELYDTLYYLLIDGQFKGFVVGKFKWTSEIEDIIVDLPASEIAEKKDAIIASVNKLAGDKSPIRRFMTEEL